MLDEDLLDLLYVRTRPNTQPRPLEAEFQDVGGDEYDDLGVSEWLREDWGWPTLDQVFLHYQILRRPPVLGLHMWQWLFFGVAFSIALMIVTVSHVYSRLRGLPPYRTRRDASKLRENRDTRVVSLDEFQTPTSLSTDITAGSPTRLAVALLRNQLTAAQLAMDKKRLFPAFQRLYPPVRMQSNTSLSSNSLSVSDRRGTRSRRKSRYGAGWGRLGDDREGSPAHRTNEAAEMLISGRLPCSRDRKNKAEAPASSEFWSPLQNLPFLATSTLPVSGKPELQQQNRWPIWTSPFLGLDLKRLLGVHLGLGLGTHCTAEEKQKKNKAKTKRPGSNSGKIESFKKTTPLFLKGLKSMTGLSRFRPRIPFISRNHRRRGPLKGVRPSSALGDPDNSTVSLEIATSDLLHGDFSRIRVKYSNSTELAAERCENNLKPRKLKSRMSACSRKSSPRTSVSESSAHRMSTSRRGSRHPPENQTRNRRNDKTHGKPPQPTYQHRKTPEHAVSGNSCVISTKEGKVSNNRTSSPFIESIRSHRSLRQTNIDKAGGVLPEVVLTSEFSCNSLQAGRKEHSTSESSKVLQYKNSYMKQHPQKLWNKSPVTSDNGSKQGRDLDQVERRRTKRRKGLLKSKTYTKDRHFQTREMVDSFGKLKYFSPKSQRDVANSSSMSISTERRASMTGTEMQSNGNKNFKLKRKAKNTSSPEIIVKESLKEMRNQQSQGNKLKKPKHEPKDRHGYYQYGAVLTGLRTDNQSKTQELGGFKEDINPFTVAKSNNVGGGDDKHVNIHSSRQHEFYKQPSQPRPEAAWTTQSVAENTHEAWQNHRLEAISEASAEMDDLLILSSSSCSYTCKQLSNNIMAQSPTLDLLEQMNKRYLPEILHTRENSKESCGKQQGYGGGSKNSMYGQDPSSRTRNHPGRRTRQAIWKSTRKQKSDVNHILSQASKINDNSLCSSHVSPQPVSVHRPGHGNKKYRIEEPGNRLGTSSSYSSIRPDLCNLRKTQKDELPPKIHCKHVLYEKLRQNHIEKDKTTMEENKRLPRPELPRCLLKTTMKSSSETDSSNIQHKLHMTVSLTSVLERKDKKSNGRNKKGELNKRVDHVADRNATHTTNESESDNSNRLARISLATHSRKPDGVCPYFKDTNVCKNISTTQSSLLEDVDGSPGHQRRAGLGGGASNYLDVYCKNESKQMSTASRERLLHDGCQLKPHAYCFESLQHATEITKIHPILQNSLKKCLPNHSPVGATSNDRMTKNKSATRNTIQLEAGSPTISFIAPKLTKPIDEGFSTSSRSDRKSSRIHSPYGTCKMLLQKVPHHKTFGSVESPQSSQSIFTSQLNNAKPTSYTCCSNKKEPNESKPYQVNLPEPEIAPRPKVPKKSLCSPRACRLHGSDVRLCENRPVHQTITHQQYTMKELQLAGYQFFKDDFGGGDTTASSRGNAPSRTKGQRSVPNTRDGFKSKVSSKISAKIVPTRKIPTRLRSPRKTAENETDEICPMIVVNKPPHRSQEESMKLSLNNDRFRSKLTGRRLDEFDSKHADGPLGGFESTSAAKVQNSFITVVKQNEPDVVKAKEPKPMSKRELMNQIRRKIGLNAQTSKTDKIVKTNTAMTKFQGGIKKIAPIVSEQPTPNRKLSALGRGRRPIWQKFKSNQSFRNSFKRNIDSSVKEELYDNGQVKNPKQRNAIELSPANNRFHLGQLKSAKTAKLEDSAMSLSNLKKFLGAVGEVVDVPRKVTKDFDKPENHSTEVAASTVSPAKRCPPAGLFPSSVSPLRSVLRKGGNDKPLSASRRQKSRCRLTTATSSRSIEKKQGKTEHVTNVSVSPSMLVKEDKQNADMNLQRHPTEPNAMNNSVSNSDKRQLQRSCSELEAVQSCESERQNIRCYKVGTAQEEVELKQLENEIPISETINCSATAGLCLKPEHNLLPLTASKQRNSHPRLLSLARGMKRAKKDRDTLKTSPKYLKGDEHNESKLALKGKKVLEEAKVPGKEEVLTAHISDKLGVFQKNKRLANSSLQTKGKVKPLRRFDMPTITSKARTSGALVLKDRAYTVNHTQKAKHRRSFSSFPAKNVSSVVKERDKIGDTKEQKMLTFEKQNQHNLDTVVVPLTDKLQLRNLTNIEGMPSELPLQALVSSNLVLTCTQVDCEEATPYRKTKLAWGVSPERAEEPNLKGHGRKHFDVHTLSKNSAQHPVEIMKMWKENGTAQSTENTHNAKMRKRHSGEGNFQNPNSPIKINFAGNTAKKVVASFADHKETSKSEILAVGNKDHVAGKVSKLDLDLPEMTSEETENYKLPDSMPKMIGCSDVSDKTLTTRDELTTRSRHQGRAFTDKNSLQTATKFNDSCLVSFALRRPSAVPESEKKSVTNDQQAMSEDQIYQRFQGAPGTNANGGFAVQQSSGSIPEPIGASDASLGGMVTPADGGTSKSGLSELAMAATSKKVPKNLQGLQGETLLERASAAHNSNISDTQKSERCESPKGQDGNEKRICNKKNSVNTETPEGIPELETTLQKEAILERSNGEKTVNKQTGRDESYECREIKRTKSQSQSQSWSLSRSHKSRSVGDSVTNTLERLTRRRLVSGRSHRRFGGSSTSPRPARGLLTRHSLPDNRWSPGVNSGSSDPTLSPVHATGESTDPRKFLKKTKPRSQSLFAALGRADETGYVASAACHSLRRRGVDSQPQRQPSPVRG